MQGVRKIRKKRRSLEAWKGLLKEYKLSGMGVGEFCALHKISRSNFYQLQARLRREEERGSEAFIPISIREEDEGAYKKEELFEESRITAGLKIRSMQGVSIEIAAGCRAGDLQVILEVVNAVK